jgi:predicted GH43/DUF377 family glycosyl hydrolase
MNKIWKCNIGLTRKLWWIVLMGAMIIGCSKKNTIKGNKDSNLPGWALAPFQRMNKVNPIIKPDKGVKFDGPIQNKPVMWEGNYTFNPAAAVRNDTIFLLYRAQGFRETSRIGLAWSTNGTSFTRAKEPVFYPANDAQKKYDWPGGTEDPRVVQDSSGTYYMSYTAWDSITARLSIATSRDLRHWTKDGLAFGQAYHGKYRNLWSKSGAIVTQKKGDHLIAKKIDGKYWMYWGDTDIYLATSSDLIHWKPVRGKNGKLLPVLRPRKGNFDSGLVESGPPAMFTQKGILLIYNSMNAPDSGNVHLPAGTYSAGQALFSKTNPKKLIGRTKHNFFKPKKLYEIKGNVNNVTFLEGLVPYHHKWYLYYGAADSTVCVAVYKPKKN